MEVREISIFFEFGAGCIHYNFTAKQPAITKLFFSEVDLAFRNENDVLLCCIVGENDAGTNLVTWGSSIPVFLISYNSFIPLFFVSVLISG